MIQLIKSTVPIQFLLSFLFLMATDVSGEAVINEFVPKGSPEWVEFLNKGDSEVNLGNYFFDDDTDFNSDSGSSPKISLQGILPSGTLCYWEMNTFLNDGGDSPTLFGVNGDTIDTYSYASSSAGLSYSRVPDGGDWQVNVSPTKTLISCLSLQTPTPIPTSTSTATPTSTPTPIPTKSPTPVPTKTPSPSPIKTLSSEPVLTLSTSSDSYVLGLRNQLTTSEPTGSPESAPKNLPILPIALVAAGVICMAGAGFAFFKKGKLPYTDNYDEGGKDS